MKFYRITNVDNETHTHAPSPEGSDYTLCGLTLDGDTVVVKKTVEITSTSRGEIIDCPDCRAIIKFCKKLRLSAQPKTGEEG